MDELEPKVDPVELEKAIHALQTLEKEREDIVLGFIKEKEITEKIHNEELEGLRKQHDEEIAALREDFMNDKEKLLHENQTQQVEHNTRETEKAKENDKMMFNKSAQELKRSEDSFKIEKRKLRDEYESVIAQKTREIEELFRENSILRSKSEPESFQNENKNTEVLVNKLMGEITTLREKQNDQIQKLQTEFDFEKSEIERNHVREKAEFMKNMNIKFDQHQENNELEKMKSYIKFQNELKEKITIVEELWNDRCNEERHKMNMRFENELEKLKSNHALELEEKLADRNKTIQDLEQEKEQLLHAIHVERFELAKFYNRELSLLNRVDSSREDIEVALIDEVAKLRDEQQKVIRNMEKRHKRKINDLKEKQKPAEEILEQHKDNIEDLKRHYEKDREEFEAQLRNEQLALLKSFEFEKSDIERYYKQVIEDRENDYKEEIKQLQDEHEKEIERMGNLEIENIELKVTVSKLNDKNNELSDKLQEFESQNARLKEELEKENRGKREQPEEMKGLQPSSDMQRTMEELSKLNIQLANQLANEQQKCEDLLKRSEELEKLYEEAQVSSDAEPCSSTQDNVKAQKDVLNSSDTVITVTTADKVESGAPLEGIARSKSTTPIQKETELQDSLQQYLLELKSIQESLDTKETEMRQVKHEYEQENNRLKKSMQDLKDSIKDVFDGDDEDDGDVETMKARQKQIKDIISQERQDDANHKRDVLGKDQTITNDVDQSKADFRAEVDALDTIIDEDLDHDESRKQLKENVNNKLKAIKANILRSHDLELLEFQQKYEKVQNKYLKELTDEKEEDFNISNKVWEAVCEKLGIEGERSKEKLQELLHKNDSLQKKSAEDQREERSDDEDNGKTINKDEVEKMKRENEDLQRSIAELEKHFKKEKKNLMKKMETQHKEYVLSPEAEVIEALTKQKALLEESFNIERFNLGRLYYMEMLDELEELMAERKDDLEKEKNEIVFRFNEDIADLFKALADKDKNEVELLKDKNAMARKMISMQRRTNEDEKKLSENELDDIKSEAEKLDAIIPLKKEIAELQRRRQEEHERNAENLGKAVDVIKDLLAEKEKEQEGKERRFSFGDSYGSTLGAEEEPTSKASPLEDFGKNTPSESRASSRSRNEKKSREPTPTGSHEQALSPSSSVVNVKSSPRDGKAHSREGTQLGSYDQALSPSRSRSSPKAHSRGATPTSSRGQTSPALSTSRSSIRGGSPRIQQEDTIEEENIATTNADPEQESLSPRSDDILCEINSKEDLLKALESLIDNAFEENKNYESDTSSGAISDFDSEPATPKSEREEGGNDSGAESIDSERLSIKKADLELALNLERFGLGRVYYNEYKDSLQDAFRRLAKAKGKSEALENKLLDSVKELVDRTNFAKASASSTEAETQTCADKVVDQIPILNETDTTSGVAGLTQDRNEVIRNKPKSEEAKQDDLKESAEENKTEEEKDIGEKTDKQVDQKDKPTNETTRTEDENQKNIEQPSKPNGKTKDEQGLATDNETATQTQVNMKAEAKNAETQTDDQTIEGSITDQDILPTDKTQTKQDPLDKLSENEPTTKEPVDENITEQLLRTAERAPWLGSGIPDNDFFEEKETKQQAENEDDAKSAVTSNKDNAESKVTEKTIGDRSPIDTQTTTTDEKETKQQAENEDDAKSAVTSNKDNAESKVTEQTLGDRSPTEPQNTTAEDAEVQKAEQLQSNEAQSEDACKDKNVQSKINEPNKELSPKEEVKEKPLEKVEKQKTDAESMSKDVLDDNTKDLAKEYKKLKDNYNILKALVGKGFVDKIPELNEKREKEQCGKSIDEDALNKLKEEEKAIAEDIKSIEQQLDGLRNMSDSNVREEEKKLNDEELEVLKELEKINDQLKQEEDNDLIELLENEKGKVQKQLEEMERDLKEKRDQIDNEEQNIFDLLKKKLDLEGNVAKKAQDLDKCHKKLADLKQDEETQNYDKKIEKLKQQEKALQDLINSHFPQLSSAGKENDVTTPQSDQDTTGQSEIATEKYASENKDTGSETTGKDCEDIKTAPQDKPKVEDIIEKLKEQDCRATKMAKKLKQAQRDRDRCSRMAEDQTRRLSPFIKKRQRLEDALGISNEQQHFKPSVLDDDALSSEDNETQDVKEKEQELRAEDRKAEKTDPRRNANHEERYSDSRNAKQVYNACLVATDDNKEPFSSVDQFQEGKTLKGGTDNSGQVKIVDPETLQRESDAIEDALKGVTDQIGFLGNKLKLTNYNTETESILGHIQTLEGEIEDGNAKIAEKEPILENTKNTNEVIKLLETKAKQESLLSDIISSLPDEFDSLPKDVQKAFELAYLINDLKKDISDLNHNVDKEETSFKEAVKYQRRGTLEESDSPFVEAVKSKEMLQKTLDDLTMQISDVHGEEKNPRILQQMIEKKNEIQQAVEKLQGEIEEEPARSAEHLSELIKSKHVKEDDLIKTAEQLKAAVKEHDLDVIPEEIANTISSQNASNASAIPSNIKDLEIKIKESAAEFKRLYQQQMNLENEEDKLVQLINEHKSIFKQPILKDDSQHVSDTVIPPVSVIAQLHKLNDDLHATEFKIEAIKKRCTDDEVAQMHELQGLIKENYEREKEKGLFENLLDNLDKKNQLEKELNENKAKKELMEVNEMIENKEREVKRLDDNIADLDALLENLINEMNNNVVGKPQIENTIKETLSDIENQIEDVHQEKEKREKKKQETADKLKEAVSSLEDELEESREELDFVDNELDGLHVDPDNESTLSKELIEMTALLNTKKRLDDYLLEINTKLDSSKDSKREPLSQEEIDTLRATKRDVENKLAEIQEEKSKFEVELQDDEIQETIDVLSEEKKQLEVQKNALVGKIHGANIFSRIADELEDEQPSDVDQQYYTHALNDMIAGPKTLIQLAKENEKLKDIACNQQTLQEDLNRRLKGSLGENLASFIALESTDNGKQPSDIPSPIIDRLANQETIQAIVSDLSNENDKLRYINDELLNDLESLKEKIGDKLANCLLDPKEDGCKTALANICNLIAGDATIQEILEDQNSDIERVNERLGKKLANALRSPIDDSILADNLTEVPNAVIIMKDEDEDLESVLAAYEEKLELLDRENNALKSMLGNDLAHALLKLDQSKNVMSVPAKADMSATCNLPEAKQEGSKAQDRRLYPANDKSDRSSNMVVPQPITTDQNKSRPPVPKRPVRPFVKDKVNEEQASTVQDRAADLEDKITKVDNKGSDHVTDIADVSAGDNFQELPQRDYEQKSRRTEYVPYIQPKTNSIPNVEALDIHEMEAPIRMAKDNKTLGEVIKGYEDELDTLRSRLGPRLFDSILAAGKLPDSKSDSPVDSITTQEDVGKSSSADTKSQYEGNQANNIKTDSESTEDKTKAKDRDELSQQFMDDKTKARTKPKVPKRLRLESTEDHTGNSDTADKRTEDRRIIVDDKEYPTVTSGTSIEDSSLTPKNGQRIDNVNPDKHQDEQTSHQTGYKFVPVTNIERTDDPFILSPKILMDENKTLEDVLKDISEELHTLKSQIGPDLYHCLLAVGRQKDKADRNDSGQEDNTPNNGICSTAGKQVDEATNDKDVNEIASNNLSKGKDVEHMVVAGTAISSRDNVPDIKERDQVTCITDDREDKEGHMYPTKVDELEKTTKYRKIHKGDVSGGDNIQEDPEGGHQQKSRRNGGKVSYNDDKTISTPNAGALGMEAPIRMAKDNTTLGEVIKGYEEELDTIRSRLGQRLFDSILAAGKLPDSKSDSPVDSITTQEDVGKGTRAEKESLHGGNQSNNIKTDSESTKDKTKAKERDELSQQFMDDKTKARTKPEVPKRPRLESTEDHTGNSDTTDKRTEDRRRIVDDKEYPTGTSGTSIEDSSLTPKDGQRIDNISPDKHQDEQTSHQTGSVPMTNIEKTDDPFILSPKILMDENKTLEDVLKDISEELQTLKSQIGPELYNCLLALGRQKYKAGRDDSDQKDNRSNNGICSTAGKQVDEATNDKDVNEIPNNNLSKGKDVEHMGVTGTAISSRDNVPDIKERDQVTSIKDDREDKEGHMYPIKVDEMEKTTKDSKTHKGDVSGGENIQEQPEGGHQQKSRRNGGNALYNDDKTISTPNAGALGMEALKRMAKNNTTLGEIIKEYEDDLDTLRSRLGPRLFDSILAAGKLHIDEDFPDDSMAEGIQKPEIADRDSLNGEEHYNKIKSEGTLSESNAKDSNEFTKQIMDEAFKEKITPKVPRRPILDSTNQPPGIVGTVDSHSEPKDSTPIVYSKEYPTMSGATANIRAEQSATEVSVPSTSLQGKNDLLRMMDENKTLEDVLTDCAEELKTLRSQIGQDLYNCLLATGKRDIEDDESGKSDTTPGIFGEPTTDKRYEGADKRRDLDQSNKKSVEFSTLEDSEKPSKSRNAGGKGKGKKSKYITPENATNTKTTPRTEKVGVTGEQEPGEIPIDNLAKYGDLQARGGDDDGNASIESGEIIDLEFSMENIPLSDGEMLAPMQMKEQNQTLEDVLKGYERDLETLKKKLGPYLYDSILDANKQKKFVAQPQEDQADYLAKPYDQNIVSSESTCPEKHADKNANKTGPPTTTKFEDLMLNDARGIDAVKAAILNDQPIAKPKEIDTIEDKAETFDSESITMRDKEDENIHPSSITEREAREGRKDDKSLFKASSLLREPDTTLQDIIEEYENALDVLTSALGPNLSKAILDSAEKKNAKKEKSGQYPDTDDRAKKLSKNTVVAPVYECDSEEQTKEDEEGDASSVNVPEFRKEKRKSKMTDKEPNRNDEYDPVSSTYGMRKPFTEKDQKGMLSDRITDKIENGTTLEDFMKKLEQENEKLKSKLGPNLTTLILDDNDTRNDRDEPKPLQDEENTEKIEKGQSSINSATVYGKLEGEKHRDVSQSARINDKSDEEVQKTSDSQLTKSQSDVEEPGNDNERLNTQNTTLDKTSIMKDGCKKEQAKQTDSLNDVLLPLLTEDNDKTLGDVMQDLCDDLQTLNKRLGPNLTRNLLRIDPNQKEALKNGTTSANDDILQDNGDTGTMKNNKARETKRDTTNKDCENMETSDEESFVEFIMNDPAKIMKSTPTKEEPGSDVLTKDTEKKFVNNILDLLPEKSQVVHKHDDQGPKFEASLSSLQTRNAPSSYITEESPIDLDALSHMSDKDQTLEEIIQKYEDTLDRYERALGPHLSKAILLASPESAPLSDRNRVQDQDQSYTAEGEENQVQSSESLKDKDTLSAQSSDDKHISKQKQEETGLDEADLKKIVKSKPKAVTISPSLPGKESRFMLLGDEITQQESENELLEEPMKLIQKGKTLEDMIVDYEENLQILKSVQGDDGELISTEDKTALYKKQIKDLETKKNEINKDVNTVKAKLGPTLFEKLKNSVHEGHNAESITEDQSLKGEAITDRKHPEEEKPALLGPDDNTKPEEKILEEPMKKVNNGKTIEDVLINYEKERELLTSIRREDGEPISIDDITEAYKKKIEQLEVDNVSMNDDLEILDKKLGARLAKQLKAMSKDMKEKGKENSIHDTGNSTEDKTFNVIKEGLEKLRSTSEPSEGQAEQVKNAEALSDSANVTAPDKKEKSTDSTQTIDQSKTDSDNMDYSPLEAPIIMDQYNQTLEEVIVEYETQLKEMLTNQEALKTELDTLEQSIGPKLFKELCALKEEQVEEHDPKKKAEEVEEKENQSKDQVKETVEELTKSSEEKHPKTFDFKAINKMNEQEKPLSSVLDDYQDNCSLLEKENQSLKKALSNVSGEFDVGEMISDYETKIQLLENENKEAEKQYEDKHKELQKEIKDLRDTLEKLAQTLRQDFLDDLMNQQDTAHSIEALQKMEKENKTLAEVVEEYEENMKRLEREKAVLEQVAGQGEEGVSILDTINDYEDSIKSLKDVNKMLNQRIDALSKKIGPVLSEQLTELCEKTDKGSAKTKEEKEKLPAVQNMKDNNVTLEDVLQLYERNIKKDGDDDKDKDTLPGNAQQFLESLEKNLGKDLLTDLSELDNKSLEELQDEEKRPIALWIMKKRNNNLADVIKLYEDYLLQYGVLDTLKGGSLASEIQEAFETIPVDVKSEAIVCEATYNDLLSSEYGTMCEDELRMADAVESRDNDIDKEDQVAKLQKQLNEEKELKEKYQKDVEDLLNDIVKLKLKNASDDENKEELERQIKEEYESKQENERMKDELVKVKSKNKELEKESEDLKYKINNMEKEIQRLEKALKEMQKGMENNAKDNDDHMAKEIEELNKKNEELAKEVEDLKNKLKEIEDNFKTEKNNLMDQKDQEKKDTIKDLLEAKAEVELQLQEQVSAFHDLEEKLKAVDDSSDKEDVDKLKELKMRNEALKEQLDHAEEAMKQALEKYQEQIKDLETEITKAEEEKKHEIELLNNKLELERKAIEKLKEEQDEILKKAKDKLEQEFENDLERERRKMKKDLEEQMDDLERIRKKHEQELNDLNDKSRKEKNDLNNLFEEEKQKLLKDFDEKMKEKAKEHERELEKIREELEDNMIAEKAELTLQFNKEKAALQSQIEKNIYGDEIQKNLDLESDFQGTLNKVLEEHASEIEDIDREMKQADKDFQQEKNKLLEAFQKEREKEKHEYENLRQEMDSNVENMLKEIIKLKHQRKEMRHQHRLEKQNMEDLFENERNQIQAGIERSKNELLAKLTEEHEKAVEHEKEKYEEIIKDLQETLDKSELRKKELEEKLRSEELKVEESKLNNVADEKSYETQKEIKVIKRSIEIEYEKKLSVEKQRFEETLQGLRREVGSLQEKRKIIQERVYHQEGSYAAEKHVIEKSIANYKLEVLAKLEGEMAQRLNRERKPLEEEIKELQTENEELKRERWEMKVHFRREKTSIEEKYEKEKETMEQNFNKEREEMRKRLEATLQKQEKVNRMGVTSGEALSSPRVDNTVRMLQQENLSLVNHNARLEADVERLTEKLESIEGNFKQMVKYEKTKAERVKQIQQEMPKGALYHDIQERSVPEYQLPSSSTQDDAVFHSLQEKDQHIQRLLETKRYYETVLGELCDEAGLFELDRNEVV